MIDDRILVKRCLEGEADSVRQLVERFQTDVLGLCFRMLCHRQDAEDVTQEVFLRVFRSLGKWDSKRPLRPWIMGIAVNRCRTWVVQRSRRPEIVDYLHETVADRTPIDAGDLSEEIAAAISELRPEYRMAVNLFHEMSMPYDEIAEVLGTPVGTIKTWLHRARSLLIARLQKRGIMTESAEAQTKAFVGKVQGK